MKIDSEAARISQTSEFKVWHNTTRTKQGRKRSGLQNTDISTLSNMYEWCTEGSTTSSPCDSVGSKGGREASGIGRIHKLANRPLAVLSFGFTMALVCAYFPGRDIQSSRRTAAVLVNFKLCHYVV